jgi:hypothetical protein
LPTLVLAINRKPYRKGAIIADPAQTAAERFAAAHRALRANADIQFDLHRMPPPQPPPAWLRAIGDWIRNALRPVGRFFDWLGSFLPDAPYARILLWSVLIAVAVALAWMAWTRWQEGAWRLPSLRRRRGGVAEVVEEDDWQPEAAPARAWLEEADALADQGRFAEAAHHLLIRSVEDIGRRRPGLVQPALTSRDLARASAVPPRARQLFSGIAAVVERSLFGGRPVEAADWAECRSAYADFARTAAWKLAA